MHVDAKGRSWDNVEYNGVVMTTADISLLAKQKGHDGVIFKDLTEYYIKSNVFLVYSGYQVRIA